MQAHEHRDAVTLSRSDTQLMGHGLKATAQTACKARDKGHQLVLHILAKCEASCMPNTEKKRKLLMMPHPMLVLLQRCQRVDRGSANAQRVYKGSANAQRVDRGSANAQRVYKGSANVQKMFRGRANAQRMYRGSASPGWHLDIERCLFKGQNN
eukprot:1161268-Pelagomonas_calceolata.AAC.2